MNLQKLIDYAASKYHIYEEYRWKDFPDFSLLVDKKSDKWLALLMRIIKDGERYEYCDMRCGSEVLRNNRLPYLTHAYRMKGDNWVGIRISDECDDELILSLFDKAVNNTKPYTYTVIIDNSDKLKKELNSEKPLNYNSGVYIYDDKIPEKISKMRQMYKYGHGFYEEKAYNFVNQGKFMEDYEDDEFWDGELKKYFPSYHDLSVRQLRGYFAWRTAYRKGDHRNTNLTFAYIYIYELLNGIGTSSLEDRLHKIEEFQRVYKNDSLINEYTDKNIRRWCFELALINNMPKDIVTEYLDPDFMKKDHSLSVLKYPDCYADEEIFEALKVFSAHKLDSSPLLKKKPNEAIRLYADLWKRVNVKSEGVKENFFDKCFGQFQTYRFYPLGNAIYYHKDDKEGFVYELSDNVGYSCMDKKWYRHGYNEQLFDRKKFDELIHETDRYLRIYYKFGHPLKEKRDEKWVDAFLKEVISEYEESLKPKIEIDLSSLDKIRQDASKTRDSLLTEEELEEETVRIEEVKKEEKQTDIHIEILKDLLAGKDVDKKLRDNHLMAEIIADQINESFYEQIGDMVVECENDRLKIVEDHRDDIEKLLEEL